MFGESSVNKHSRAFFQAPSIQFVPARILCKLRSTHPQYSLLTYFFNNSAGNTLPDTLTCTLTLVNVYPSSVTFGAKVELCTSRIKLIKMIMSMNDDDDARPHFRGGEGVAIFTAHTHYMASINPDSPASVTWLQDRLPQTGKKFFVGSNFSREFRKSSRARSRYFENQVCGRDFLFEIFRQITDFFKEHIF